jgi:hypothetical protein
MGSFSFSFDWPPSWDLPSPPSFNLKGWIQIIWGSFFSNIIFNSILRNLAPTTFFGRRNFLILVNGIKKESRLDVWGSFERMEVNGDSVGNLKS